MLPVHRLLSARGPALAVAALTVTVLAVGAPPALAGPAPVVPAAGAAKSTVPAPGVTPRIGLPAAAGLPSAADLPAAGGLPKAAGHDLTFGLDRGESLVRKGTSTSTPSTIVSFDLPPKGSNAPLGGYGTYLVLQADGNLVEYETTTGKVLFATGANRGVRFTYQSDGNAVLYGAGNAVLFQTRTSGDKVGRFLLSYGNGQMLIQSATGRVVTAFGTAVTPAPGVVTRFADSPNGRYQLVVQSDGNVVAYDLAPARPRAVWNTGTGGRGKARFAVQRDGNLVLYAYPSNTVLWASHSNQPGSAYYQLDMKNNGNVVLYRTNGSTRLQQVWASGSGRN